MLTAMLLLKIGEIIISLVIIAGLAYGGWRAINWFVDRKTTSTPAQRARLRRNLAIALGVLIALLLLSTFGVFGEAYQPGNPLQGT
jgi:uncharacterized membrane protein